MLKPLKIVVYKFASLLSSFLNVHTNKCENSVYTNKCGLDCFQSPPLLILRYTEAPWIPSFLKIQNPHLSKEHHYQRNSPDAPDRLVAAPVTDSGGHRVQVPGPRADCEPCCPTRSSCRSLTTDPSRTPHSLSLGTKERRVSFFFVLFLFAEWALDFNHV